MISSWQTLRSRYGVSLLGLTICLLFNVGCASRTAYVVARQDPQYQLSVTNKIAIADHAQPREEEQTLRAALMLELRNLHARPGLTTFQPVRIARA